MTMTPGHAIFRSIDIGAGDMARSVITEQLGDSKTDLPPAATAPINQAKWRNRIRATGTVRALQVQVTETGSSLGCEIGDEAGSLLLVFPGRRRSPGIELGARVLVEGMVGLWRRRLAILNPYYELVSD
jgi:hypothetical protein